MTRLIMLMRCALIAVLFHAIILNAYCQAAKREIVTLEVFSNLKDSFQPYYANQSAIEQFTNHYIKTGNPVPSSIPVVFHVVYNNANENISNAQIISQIDALNRDFGLLGQIPSNANPDFVAKAADTQISFCLSTLTPDGQPTTGITRTNSAVASWTINDAIKSDTSGGINPWETDRFLNIWVGRLNDTISGYAQLPGGPTQTDGIVIDYRFVGTLGTVVYPYEEGKTLTHLVGNYLNLLPLWGETKCSDDGVDDTPLHNAPNVTCDAGHHRSTCWGYNLEMTCNFMDNTPDECMFMFTQGQKMRMHALLTTGGARNGLIQSCGSSHLSFTNNTNEETIEEAESKESEGIAELFEVSIYPNPSMGALTVDINSGEERQLVIQLIDVNQKSFYHTGSHMRAGRQAISINCDNCINGLYTLIILDRERGMLWTERILLAK